MAAEQPDSEQGCAASGCPLILRPFLWQAHLVRRLFPPTTQLAIGALLVNLGIVLHVLGPICFTSEPPATYQMSAGALLLTGLGVLFTAEVLVETTDN